MKNFLNKVAHDFSFIIGGLTTVTTYNLKWHPIHIYTKSLATQRTILKLNEWTCPMDLLHTIRQELHLVNPLQDFFF